MPITLTRALAAGIALALSASVASADTWTSKPIKFVVTFPTGGAPDILARLFSEKAQLGQPIIVDNKPGAGGNIGADLVAKSQPDGYTLVMGTVGTHSINQWVFPKMPYDMVRDFTPITLLASTVNLLVVNNDLPVKSVQELIAYGKANPGKLVFGSPGIGTSPHVSGEMLKSMAGLDWTHVPYKGRQYALPDLIGGQVHLMFDTMPSVLPMVRDGKMRALASTSTKREASAPEIPTVAESGLPGFDVTSWYAVFAPAGTPKPIVDKLYAEFLRVYGLPDVKARLDKLGLDLPLSTPDELTAFQAKEVEKWKKVVEEAGVKIQ